MEKPDPLYLHAIYVQTREARDATEIAKHLGELCESLTYWFRLWAEDACERAPWPWNDDTKAELVQEAAVVLVELASAVLDANLTDGKHLVNWLRDRVRNRLKKYVHNKLAAGIVPWDTLRKRRQRGKPGHRSTDPVRFVDIDKFYWRASQDDYRGNRQGIDSRWIESNRSVPWELIYVLASTTLRVAAEYPELYAVCLALRGGASVRSAARAIGRRESTVRGWLERLRNDVLLTVPEEVRDAALEYFVKKTPPKSRKTRIVPNRNDRGHATGLRRPRAG